MNLTFSAVATLVDPPSPDVRSVLRYYCTVRWCFCCSIRHLRFQTGIQVRNQCPQGPKLFITVFPSELRQESCRTLCRPGPEDVREVATWQGSCRLWAAPQYSANLQSFPRHAPTILDKQLFSPLHRLIFELRLS